MRDVKIDRDNLENFLDYLQDKVEDYYKKETERAIKEFLKELK